jgi:hypothetical protein
MAKLDENEKFNIAYVSVNGLNIKHIENPSELVQKIAITKYIWSMAYIKNPSNKIQIYAVKLNPIIISDIINPCLACQKIAVENNGFLIKHIKNPSKTVQKLAIISSPSSINYIQKPSVEILEFFISSNEFKSAPNLWTPILLTKKNISAKILMTMYYHVTDELKERIKNHKKYKNIAKIVLDQLNDSKVVTNNE